MIFGLGVLCTGPRPAPPPTDLACDAFAPITWSLRDTDPTIAEVKQHNAAWQRLCGPASAPPARPAAAQTSARAEHRYRH
jgi:hypothetical protein